MKMSDIDIDLPQDFNPGNYFPWTRASMVNNNNELVPHLCGVHPQKIPVDPLTGLSAIPYKDAENEGFFKIDFLHLSIYNEFQSREQIEEILQADPDWGLLLDASIQRQLFQLAKHGDVLDAVKPKSIAQIADVLALIRPGRREMLDDYLANPQETRKRLYSRGADGYIFKKSHAIAYAMVIVLQLHLLG